MKTKHYKVWSSRTGKIFETLAEAEAYADHIFRATGIFVTITETKAAVTHIYRF